MGRWAKFLTKFFAKAWFSYVFQGCMVSAQGGSEREKKMKKFSNTL